MDDDWPKQAGAREFLADLRLRQPPRPTGEPPRRWDPTAPKADVAVVADLFVFDESARVVRLKRLDELTWYQRMQLKLLALRERGWKV